jgi:hypothetical protein
MSDPILGGLNDDDKRDIMRLAQDYAKSGASITIEAATVALIKRHLILVRDCGGILPVKAEAGTIKIRGVSLGGGING